MNKKLKHDFFKEFRTDSELLVYCIENDITAVTYDGVVYSISEISDFWNNLIETKNIKHYVPKHLLSEESKDDSYLG